jgi:hypothetical protein
MVIKYLAHDLSRSNCQLLKKLAGSKIQKNQSSNSKIKGKPSERHNFKSKKQSQRQQRIKKKH